MYFRVNLGHQERGGSWQGPGHLWEWGAGQGRALKDGRRRRQLSKGRTVPRTTGRAGGKGVMLGQFEALGHRLLRGFMVRDQNRVQALEIEQREYIRERAWRQDGEI